MSVTVEEVYDRAAGRNLRRTAGTFPEQRVPSSLTATRRLSQLATPKSVLTAEERHLRVKGTDPCLSSARAPRQTEPQRPSLPQRGDLKPRTAFWVREKQPAAAREGFVYMSNFSRENMAGAPMGELDTMHRGRLR